MCFVFAVCLANAATPGWLDSGVPRVRDWVVRGTTPTPIAALQAANRSAG
jgi:hypothetical protein